MQVLSLLNKIYGLLTDVSLWIFTYIGLLIDICTLGEWREKEEYFVDLPPELCELKIVGFSKDIGSSLSLLPSILHRLESFLVAIELKDKFSASFPGGAEVTTNRVSTILKSVCLAF